MGVKCLMKVVCACFIGASFPSNAALVTGDVLEFDTSQIGCLTGGTYPDNCTDDLTGIVSGSYWSMDINGSGTVDSFEKFVMSMNEGIKIGVTQSATGSHTGQPDGTEMPSIDNPWNFKANTGMHTTSSPVTEVNDLGGGVMELDFSGWGLTWNGLPFINLGGGFQDCGVSDDGICVAGNGDDIAGQFNNGTSIATITCSSVLCSQGDAYTLEYAATVLQADPSGFGGVYYGLHLEGTIGAVPIPSAVWLFGSGLLGLIGVARRK